MPGPWKLLPCAECCGGCDYFNEIWDVAGSPGSDWLEINTASGSWTVTASPTFTVSTSDTGAGVVTTVSNPEATNFVIIKITLPSELEEDTEYKLIVDYVDEDNYYFAQIDSAVTTEAPVNTFTTVFNLSMWQRVSGVDTLLRERWEGEFIETDPADRQQWWGCLSPDGFATTVGDRIVAIPSLGSPWRPFPDGLFWEMTPASDVVGFAAGTIPAGGDVTFGPIQLTRHTVDEPTCDPCVTCLICSGFPPEEFEVTVTGITSGALGFLGCHDDASTLNGVYIVTYDHDASVTEPVTGVVLARGCRWRFNFSGPCGIEYLQVIIFPFIGLLGNPFMVIEAGFFSSLGKLISAQSELAVRPYTDCMSIDVTALITHLPPPNGPDTMRIVALTPAS